MNMITKILSMIGCTSASTHEHEYSSIKRKINRLCKTRNDRKRTCQTEDDAFFDGIQHNIDEQVDRLSETHNNLLAILNTFPINTPCTIDSIANRAGLQTSTVQRLLLLRYEVYNHRVATACKQSNWRFGDSDQQYLERFEED